MTKPYSKAPLSFIGQKRNFIKAFRQVLQTHIDDDGNGWTIIDVFGGSGLLAHNAKHLLPNATVIYNDFDGYTERLNHIDDTERLRQQIFTKLAPLPRHKVLSAQDKQAVIDIINNFDGFIDVHSIANWVLFSGKQVKTLDELYQNTFYNTIRKNPYEPATHYLDGLIITTESYTTLMAKYKDKPKTLFLLDPPYLYTGQGAYHQDKYFAMVDFLYLMSLTRPPYIFFSSTKSELLDYLDYLKQLNGDDWERLGCFERVTIQAHVNHERAYEDNMIYRF
nr:DNA adenine methylase [Moraxella sp. CTOTU47616]